MEQMSTTQQLLWAGIHRNKPVYVQQALQNGANPNLPDRLGYFPLSQASSPIVAKLLLDAEAHLNKGHAFFPDTPLMITSDTATAIFLIKAGIDVHAVGNSGQTALHHWVNHPVVLKALLAKTVNPNVRDLWGRVPLMRVDNFRSAELLLEAGANVNAVDYDGKTALMHIFDTDIFKRILSKNPDVNQRDQEGKTAAMYHVSSLERMKLLADKNADFKSRDNQRAGLLHYALPYPDTFRFLLKKGLNPNLKDIFGKKPMDYMPKEETVDILKTHLFFKNMMRKIRRQFR